MLKLGRIIDAAWGGIALGLTLLSKFTGALIVPVCISLAAVYLWKYRSIPLRNCFIFGAFGFVVLLLGYQFDPEPFFAGIAFSAATCPNGSSGISVGRALEPRLVELPSRRLCP